ncbi:putative tRNA/rRNA methyltransferase [Yersinia pestis]|nr:putative tRNA/rRNA methyltransferase [Yersinia pestis]
MITVIVIITAAAEASVQRVTVARVIMHVRAIIHVRVMHHAIMTHVVLILAVMNVIVLAVRHVLKAVALTIHRGKRYLVPLRKSQSLIMVVSAVKAISILPSCAVSALKKHAFMVRMLVRRCLKAALMLSSGLGLCNL